MILLGYYDIIINLDRLNCTSLLCLFPTLQLGKIGKAQEDLNKAIELEPALLDAYWHRHLVYMLENKKPQALDDLNFLLKHNKNHAGAYRSRYDV